LGIGPARTLIEPSGPGRARSARPGRVGPPRRLDLCCTRRSRSPRCRGVVPHAAAAGSQRRGSFRGMRSSPCWLR